MGLDAAPHCSFRGDAHRIRRDRRRRDPEPFEVVPPGSFVAEAVLVVLGQLGDHRAAQATLAHVGQGLGIDHVIAVAGLQDLQEAQPAFRRGRGERGEVVVADLRADAVAVLVTGAGVVDADPALFTGPWLRMGNGNLNASR